MTFLVLHSCCAFKHIPAVAPWMLHWPSTSPSCDLEKDTKRSLLSFPSRILIFTYLIFHNGFLPLTSLSSVPPSILMTFLKSSLTSAWLKTAEHSRYSRAPRSRAKSQPWPECHYYFWINVFATTALTWVLFCLFQIRLCSNENDARLFFRSQLRSFICVNLQAAPEIFLVHQSEISCWEAKEYNISVLITRCS